MKDLKSYIKESLINEEQDQLSKAIYALSDISYDLSGMARNAYGMCPFEFYIRYDSYQTERLAKYLDPEKYPRLTLIFGTRSIKKKLNIDKKTFMEMLSEIDTSKFDGFIGEGFDKYHATQYEWEFDPTKIQIKQVVDAVADKFNTQVSDKDIQIAQKELDILMDMIAKGKYKPFNFFDELGRK